MARFPDSDTAEGSEQRHEATVTNPDCQAIGLMERRILHRLRHSMALLRDEQLGNLLQLFLQPLVLLNEKLYQKAVLLNLLLQSVKLCLEFITSILGNLRKLR